jgi:hypothetical protein
MKAKHETSATAMPDADAASGAKSLLSVLEAGGIGAHSMHVGTINVHLGATEATGEVYEDAVRGSFTPEVARVVARKVYVLGLAVPSFVTTSVEMTATPSDT